jgi:predicted phage terminase large subunit-like protein
MSNQLDLSGIDIHELLLDIEREKCRRSMSYFVQKFWSTIDPAHYTHNWHVDTVCEALQGVAEGRINRLVVNIPPGHMKSLLIGVFFNAWLWGPAGLPQKQVLSTSHSQDFSARDTRRTRELITSQEFQELWPITLAGDQDSKTNFVNTHKGQRQAKSFGSLTGARGNILVIDDPISANDAFSDAARANVKQIFLESVPTRLNNLEQDAIIIIAQRLHEEDIVGVIQQAQLPYEFVVIPTEFEGKTTINEKLNLLDPRKQNGELLFPKLFPRTEIENLKKSLGPYGFAAQHQQTPSPRTNGFFDVSNIHWYEKEELPKKEHLNIYMASDNAPSGNNDYNVHVVYGIDKNFNFWYLDGFYEQCQMNTSIGLIEGSGGFKMDETKGALALLRKWNPMCWFPENDNNWKSVENFVKIAMRQNGLNNRIIPLQLVGQGNKEAKAQSMDAAMRQGLVHLPANWHLKTEFLAELASFPMGAHDDMVDAHSNFFRAQRLHQNVIKKPVVREGPVDGYKPVGQAASQRGHGGGNGFYG